MGDKKMSNFEYNISKIYPIDISKTKKTKKTFSIFRTHINKSFIRGKAPIQQGSVLIILAGRYKGKRVIFLRQLDSGLLLISGPYKINGVPLRRVNRAYV